MYKNTRKSFFNNLIWKAVILKGRIEAFLKINIGRGVTKIKNKKIKLPSEIVVNSCQIFINGFKI